MALRAELIQHDGLVHLDLYPDEQRLRTIDDPELVGYKLRGYIWFYWDDEKLDRGEREFLGVEVDNIAKLTAEDRYALDRIAPRIDVPELGLTDVTVSDVLQRVQRSFAHQSVPSSLQAEV